MRTLDSVLREIAADAEPEAGRRFLDLVARYLAETRAGLGPVTTAHTPGELAARFDEPLPTGGHPLDEVVARLEREAVAEATRLTHPMYFGHQVSAPLPSAIWTEAVISALNNSTAVQEMAPAVTMIEHRLVRWFGDLVGWGAGSGGALTSGGTEATFAALLAARAAALPDAWQRGVGADPPLVIYAEHAHYAVSRAVAQLGLGLDHGIVIPMRQGRMDTEALALTLDRLARDGRRVMAVVATAGSTPTGSFDDLDAIGQLCQRHGVWLHVDGAHGASALLSPTHRHRLAGLHRARSLAWDPHKMMLLPLSAGMVLVREVRELDQAYTQRAPYLFHAPSGEAGWDQGPRSFQCSRRADALKLWVVLQRHGADGLGLLYDRLCATAAELHRAVMAHPAFEPCHIPESNILCFRYRAEPSTPEAALDDLNFRLRQAYNRSGRGWLTTTLLEGRRVLRAVVMNPLSGPAQVEALLDGLVATARSL